MLSIYSVTALRERKESIEREYKDSLRRHTTNLDQHSILLTHAHLTKEAWLSTGTDRGASITYWGSYINLYLRFGPNDKLDSILLFLEEFFPNLTLDSKWSPTDWIFPRTGLDIQFNLEDSKHCMRVEKPYTAKTYEYVCI